jgi:hypothetical protein
MNSYFNLRFAGIVGLCLVLAACSDSNDNRGGDNPLSEAKASSLCAAEGILINPERLFLQQLTATSVIVKWRGEGLTADALYYCSAGDNRNGSAELAFRTAAVTGALPVSGQIRILVVGDSGTASQTVEEHNPAPSIVSGYG